MAPTGSQPYHRDTGSQPHRRDVVQPDGTWHDYIDQEDCCKSVVISTLPELGPLVGTTVTVRLLQVTWEGNDELRRQVLGRLERLPSGDDLDGG
jgi:hypothetical protein